MVGRDILRRTGGAGAAAAAFACATLATGAPPASATTVNCGSITASGSSLQNLAQKTVWTKDWEDNSINGWTVESEGLVCEEEKVGGVGTGKGTGKVVYEPTSSGKGLKEWGDENTAEKIEMLKPEESFNKTSLDAFVGTDVGPEGVTQENWEKFTKEEKAGQIREGAVEEVLDPGTQINRIDWAGGRKNPTTGEEEKNKITTIPIATSAVALIVTLPEECEVKGGEKANVSLAELVKEWKSGEVKFSALIKNLNKPANKSCEDDTPVLQAREVPSGTTAGYKRYLAALDPTDFGPITTTAGESESNTNWPLEVAKSADFNETGNETGGKLAEKVFGTPSTMGYADIADARSKGFAAAAGEPTTHAIDGKMYESIVLLVPNGTTTEEGTNLVSPEVEGGGTPADKAANCKGAKFPEPKRVGPDIEWSRAEQTNSTSNEPGVYPICTLTFDVAWKHYSWARWENPLLKVEEQYTEAQYDTTFNYLRWVVTAGQKTQPAEQLEEAHFAPVPKNVQEEDEKGVTTANIGWG